MDRSEKAIFTNMCMIYDEQGNVVIQNRRSRKWGGITFPGGHVERGESFQDAVIREVFEETGLHVEKPILCGIKQWPNEDGARYVVLLYKTNHFSGELISSQEGEVSWISLEKMFQSNLAPGMDHMLQVFLNEDVNEHYFRIENGKWIEELK